MRIVAIALVVLFACAEMVRPTQAIFPKRNAGDGLILRAQSDAPIRGSLDQRLLDDLPRIRPDARGAFDVITIAPNARVARGEIRDSYTGGPGAAVFAIVHGRRIAGARTTYRNARFTIALPSRAAASSISVGLIPSDQRGYFRLNPCHAERSAAGARSKHGPKPTITSNAQRHTVLTIATPLDEKHRCHIY